eukprot:118605_1
MDELKENMMSDETIMDEIQMTDNNSEKRNTLNILDHTSSGAVPSLKPEISNADIVAAMQQKECSLSSSSSESDITFDKIEPKLVSTIALQHIDTEYDLQRASTVRNGDIIATKPPVPTTIKTTSIGHSESEDDYHTTNEIASQLQLDQQCAAIRKDMNTNYIKYKWRKLITKPLLCSRVLALILTIILLIVSLTYCVAQLCEVELDLLIECPPPVKTREQIWAHYEERSLQSSTPGKLTSETQHGLAKDNCWSTKSFDLNIDVLFYSNNYKHQWKENMMDAKMILFGFISMYCVVIMIYNIMTIVYDVTDVNKNRLHTKSPLYRDGLRQQNGGNVQQGRRSKTSIQNSKAKESLMLNKFRAVRKWYDKYFATDTTGWIIVMFIHECMEIVLQSQALLMYNGYYVLDPNNQKDIYLANKPEYVVAFASILAFNCWGSGLCWLSYSLAHRKCHGLLFKFSIFFVDQFSDLFYTMFPFLIIFTDSYNLNRGNLLVLLGQLNVDSGLAFIAAFIPLLFLCNKCLFITINSVRKMRDDYYNQWKFIQDILCQPNHQLIAYQAQLHGLKTDKQFMDSIMQKEIYDAQGNIQLNIKQVTNRSKVNWIDKDKRTIKSIIKEVALVIMSLLYIVWGILVLSYTIKYLNRSEDYCTQIQEDKFFDGNGTFKANITLNQVRLLGTNPELFAWHHCLYPVYPFVMEDQYKCQCRVFVIDWRTDFMSNVQDRHEHLNVTQNMILQGALTNWIMLEKFKTVGTEGDSIGFGDNYITSDMFKARKMKAFEWGNMQISRFEEGISGWTELEYFRLDRVGVSTLPSDFEQLTKMKYFRAEYSGLQAFPVQLCSLNHLFGIHIEWGSITSIPHCVVNLLNLEIVILNGLVELTDVPIALFSLPHLRELSIWHGAITYENLIAFNNVTDDLNATDEIETYFNEHFNWNAGDDHEYYISLNDICDEKIREELPSKLQQFINETNACHYPCLPDQDAGFIGSFCPANVYGNGICDFGCNFNLCHYDGGDCVQLCFAKSFSDCTWDLFENDVCDAECDNSYCAGYHYGSSFVSANGVHKTVNGTYGEYTADNHWCLSKVSNADNLDEKYQSTSNLSCWESFIYNEYKDAHQDETQWPMSKCMDWWIGDGLCDDACRTDSCLHDNGDCELRCLDDTCHLIFNLWSYLNPTGEDLVPTAMACADFWTVAQTLFEIDESWNCTELVMGVDYNEDKHMNFREFVVLALTNFREFQRIYSDGGWQRNKGPQVNCSSCVGMQHYNVKFEQ